MLEEKDIKKGNLVECLEDSIGGGFTEGKIYEIAKNGMILGNYVELVEDDKGRAGNGINTNYFKLHKPKEDLRDLLQVGYRIDNFYQVEYIKDEYHIDYLKREFDEKLYGKTSGTTIDTICKPKYNGIKPMEWVEVWKREEELFTLKLPNEFMIRNTLTFHKILNKFDFKKEKEHDTESLQQRFTQEEIINLHNQHFIRTLIQKKVEK